MSDGELTFIVPVRHPRSTADWGTLRSLLGVTLRSIASQTSQTWRCVVVANRDSDLPPMPRHCEACWVDLPLQEMPADRSSEAFYEALRNDKGRRVLAGIKHARPHGHVMVVDADDWICPKLAELVAAFPDAAGWTFHSGWLYSGGAVAYLMRRGFSEFCGTSHVIRSDLLWPYPLEADPPPDAVKQRLGSHRYIEHMLEAQGAPLQPLPFVGAAYRIGHATSGTVAKGLVQHLFPPGSLRRPRRTLRHLLGLRPVSAIGFPVPSV